MGFFDAFLYGFREHSLLQRGQREHEIARRERDYKTRLLSFLERGPRSADDLRRYFFSVVGGSSFDFRRLTSELVREGLIEERRAEAARRVRHDSGQQPRARHSRLTELDARIENHVLDGVPTSGPIVGVKDPLKPLRD